VAGSAISVVKHPRRRSTRSRPCTRRLKAIALNLLSVGAAYGVLVLVFQQGQLESLLGFTSIGGVTAWLPLHHFYRLDPHTVYPSVAETADRPSDTACSKPPRVESE
jgi:hypothetical protein